MTANKKTSRKKSKKSTKKTTGSKKKTKDLEKKEVNKVTDKKETTESTEESEVQDSVEEEIENLDENSDDTNLDNTEITDEEETIESDEEDSCKSDEKQELDYKEEYEKLNEKHDKLARNLIKIYDYIKGGVEFDDLEVVKDLEINTPGETLRKENMQIKLEMESISEENQVLREGALQNQVEWEAQIDLYNREKTLLKEKIKKMEDITKKEIKDLKTDYEAQIDELRNNYRLAVEKNEKISQVSEGIVHLQKQIKFLFDENEDLRSERNELKESIEELQSIKTEQDEKLEELMNENAKLLKKTELQKMVIDGHKRKEEERRKLEKWKELQKKAQS